MKWPDCLKGLQIPLFFGQSYASLCLLKSQKNFPSSRCITDTMSKFLTILKSTVNLIETLLRLNGLFTRIENTLKYSAMAIKVNDHVIPDWAIEGKLSLLYKVWPKKWRTNHLRLFKWPPLTWPKTGLIDQTLMSQESQRRKYEVDPGEVNKQMKQWIQAERWEKSI